MGHNRTGLGHFHDTMVSQNSSAWWLPCLGFKAYSLPESLQEYWWYLGHLKKNAVRSMRHETSWDGEKSTQENYIRMRTPQEGFIGVDLNVLRLKMFRTPKSTITGRSQVWFKKSFRHCKFSRHSKCFFCRSAIVCNQNVKLLSYQLSYVIKYYELRLGFFLTKHSGRQALGCWSRSWAMRSQDSQRQCPTAVTHAFHDDLDENWPTLQSFSRRSME